MMEAAKRHLRSMIFHSRDHRRVKDYLRREAQPKLQLGTGSTPLEGWLNTDLLASRTSIALDATRPFRFPNETFQYVYSEHMLAILTVSQAQKFAKECWRVLRPGGVLRIATADLGFFAAAALHPAPDSQRYMEWAKNTFWPWLPRADAATILSMHLHTWNVKLIYDAGSLGYLLQQAGFCEVKRCDVGKSEHPALSGVERHGTVIPEEFNRMESLVMEARKPEKK